VVNDAAAYARSLAERHGRNADWAERAVREAASLPAEEALRDSVVDLVCSSLETLLREVDGRAVRLERGEVVLRTAGLVQQASGEDWTDVELWLSTAIPGQGIEVPELLTWALGEKREFIPRVQPARMPPEPALFPPPAAGMSTGQAERSARFEVLRTRLSELQVLASALEAAKQAPNNPTRSSDDRFDRQVAVVEPDMPPTWPPGFPMKSIR
jgi:hypothetical protein